VSAHHHFTIRCECGRLLAGCGCPAVTAAQTVGPCRCGATETTGSSQREECAACPVEFRNLFHVAAELLARGVGRLGLLDLKDAVEAARPLVDDHIAHPRRPRLA
jgi:hypothetical protein